MTLVSSISTGAPMTSFSASFSSFMGSDVCSQTSFNCSLLASDTLHQYGIKVVSQYLENYFRQQNSSALTSSNPQNTLITYS
jgi:hypothetical protein